MLPLPYPALAALLLAASPPLASDAGVLQEVDVAHTDGGLALQADAGTQAPAPLQPPTLLADAPATFPEALREARLGGQVQLELLVDEEGLVTEVKVLQADHPLFAEAAEAAAPSLRFTPASLGGTPVAVRLPFTYVFTPPAEAARAPEAVLSGEVRQKGTRRAVAGASVRVDTPAGEQVAETDAEGRFSLSLPPGTLLVRVDAPGHEGLRLSETLADGQALTVRYALLPHVVDPYQTVVRAERERVEVSSVQLREQELREVPGTAGDPLRVVMLMPGVASIGSGISYPVVRGTQPAATGYFIDGVRVPLLFHLALGPGVIHPDFLEAVDFYPGAPPVRFGRLMGGAVEGRVSRPREDRLRASVGADLTMANAFVEVPFRETGTSVTLAGRISYTGPMIAALANASGSTGNQEAYADLWDYQARVEQRLGEGRLRLFAFGASDGLGTRAKGEDTFAGGLFQRFHRVDLRYGQPLLGGQGEVGLTAGLESMGLAAEYDRKRLAEFSTNQATFAARAGFLRDFGEAWRLEAGAELENRRAHIVMQVGETDFLADSGGVSDPLLRPASIATFGTTWAQLRWQPDGDWTVTPGVRLESYKLQGGPLAFVAEPRLTVRRRLSDVLTLKAGAGLFHQAPTVLLALPVVDVSGLTNGVQEGVQLDVGAEWRAATGLEVTADAYFNPLVRTVEFNLEEVLENRRRRGLPSTSAASRGMSYGGELMVRHPLGGNWFGWVSYSFNQSVRDTRFTRYDEAGTPLETVTAPLPFAFQQAHVLNAALSVKLPGQWTVGSAVHFNTGRPESGELSSRTQRLLREGQPDWAWKSADADAVATLPSFWRLDARVSKDFVYESWSLQLYLDVLNLTLSRETLGYFYWEEPEGISPEGIPTGRRPIKQPVENPIVMPTLGLKGTY